MKRERDKRKRGFENWMLWCGCLKCAKPSNHIIIIIITTILIISGNSVILFIFSKMRLAIWTSLFPIGIVSKATAIHSTHTHAHANMLTKCKRTHMSWESYIHCVCAFALCCSLFLFFRFTKQNIYTKINHVQSQMLTTFCHMCFQN